MSRQNYGVLSEWSKSFLYLNPRKHINLHQNKHKFILHKCTKHSVCTQTKTLYMLYVHYVVHRSLKIHSPPRIYK